MKIFILDGYNVIYKMPGMKERLTESLEVARNALALYLSGWRRRYPNAEVYIVFDGNDRMRANEQNTRLAGIKCIFTHSRETADERIISLIRNSPNPRNITVITEDNSIRNSSRAHGAEVKTVDFLISTRKKKAKESKGRDKDTLPANQSRVTGYYKEYLRNAGKI